MQIIHKIDDFLFAIFPELETGENNELIANYLKDYYSFGPHQPSVRVDDGWVIVEIDLPAIAAQEAEYQKAVALCEKGRYAEAKPILQQLIAQNPGQSEYHRIMGQALSEEANLPTHNFHSVLGGIS
jgi:tetratricopeptide (TPR) repeat protein